GGTQHHVLTPCTVSLHVWRVVGVLHCRPLLQVSCPGMQFSRRPFVGPALPLFLCLCFLCLRLATVSSWCRAARPPTPRALAARKRTAPRRVLAPARLTINRSNVAVSMCGSRSGFASSLGQLPREWKRACLAWGPVRTPSMAKISHAHLV